MFYVIFTLQRRDVGPTERLAAFMAQQVKTSKVIRLAEWVLSWGLFRNREELGRYNFSAVLDTVSMILV